VGVALSYGSSPQFGDPFNISVIAEASEFKFGIELVFATSKKSHRKTTVGVALIWRASKNLGDPL